MKKIGVVICLVAALIMTSSMAFSADPLYRMLHADEVESFKADQDAAIVGQLTGKKDDTFTVKVLKVISGKVKSDTISVKDNFAYQGFSEENSKPQVNDFCFLSLKNKGSYYEKVWYTVKADSGDYRTLKLLFEDIHFGGGDIPAIQWYVNSEGKDKDFFFSGNRIFLRKPDGENVKIYEYEEKNTTPAPAEVKGVMGMSTVAPEQVKAIGQQTDSTALKIVEGINRWSAVGIAAAILAVVVITGLILRLRGRKLP